MIRMMLLALAPGLVCASLTFAQTAPADSGAVPAPADSAAAADSAQAPADSAAAADSAQAPAVSAAATDSSSVPAPADTAGAALDDYLESLSEEDTQDFLLDELSISDAEVDSLIQVWQSTGESPVPPDSLYRGPDRLRADFELGAARYNRVEGLNVMPRLVIRPPGPVPLGFHGQVGYGWASEVWTWRGGLRARLPFAGWPLLEVTHARDVYSYGAGGLPGNTALALFSGKDWDDYYQGEGLHGRLIWSRRNVAFGVGFLDEVQTSLATAASLTLFEGDHDFRPNPAINEGRLRVLRLGLTAGDATQDRLAASFSAHRAGEEFGGDFDYHRFRTEVTARQRLWFGDELRARLTAGFVEGDAPYQALHHVGGTRLLRGYEINEIPAREVTALSLDYKLGTNILGYVPWVRRLRLQPVPFFDTAVIYETQTPDGTRVTPADPEFRFSAGLGIQQNILGIPGGAGQIRMDIARRLDRADDSMTYRLGFTIER